jgi:hypothetical protein
VRATLSHYTPSGDHLQYQRVLAPHLGMWSATGIDVQLRAQRAPTKCD